MDQEPERTQSIVDGHHHGAFGSELGRVVVAGAGRRQPTAVDPDDYRTAATTIKRRRRIRVAVETVLADLARRREAAAVLRATRRELARIANSPPF